MEPTGSSRNAGATTPAVSEIARKDDFTLGKIGMNTRMTNNRRTDSAAIYAAMAGFVPSCAIKKTG
jgi:hypothetical protein